MKQQIMQRHTLISVLNKVHFEYTQVMELRHERKLTSENQTTQATMTCMT